MQAIERPEAPDVPEGYVVSLGLLALVDAEQGRTESAQRGRGRRSASRASDSKPTPGLRRWRTSGLRWRAPRRTPRRGRARGAARRATATLAAAHRRSRSRPARARARPRRAITARARRQRPRTRAHGRSPSLPIPDGSPRSRPPSRTTSPPPERTSEAASSSRNPARPSSPCCAGLATGLSRREIGAQLYISLNTVKTPYPRAVPQARRDIASGRGRARRSARSARSHRITRVIVRRDAQIAATRQAC